jgi:hypothetical protein
MSPLRGTLPLMILVNDPYGKGLQILQDAAAPHMSTPQIRGAEDGSI